MIEERAHQEFQCQTRPKVFFVCNRLNTWADFFVDIWSTPSHNKSGFLSRRSWIESWLRLMLIVMIELLQVESPRLLITCEMVLNLDMRNINLNSVTSASCNLVNIPSMNKSIANDMQIVFVFSFVEARTLLTVNGNSGPMGITKFVSCHMQRKRDTPVASDEPHISLSILKLPHLRPIECQSDLEIWWNDSLRHVSIWICLYDHIRLRSIVNKWILSLSSMKVQQMQRREIITSFDACLHVYRGMFSISLPSGVAEDILNSHTNRFLESLLTL